MKHYPATRHTAQIAGLEHSHAPTRISRTTFLLALATAFAAGFCASIWTVGLIVTGP